MHKCEKKWYRLGDLQLNEMYTITGFNPYDGGLILKEAKSPRSAYHAFTSNRFRKVDYSFAEKMLVEISQEESNLQTEPQFKKL